MAEHLSILAERLAAVPAESAVDPMAFRWHPEVWLLVISLTGAYVYMVRVIGPNAVPKGQSPVSRFNVISFVLAMVMLWFASGWPIHDIGEEYLYSAHMLQHMMLSFFMAPLALMATPTWLARILFGDGRLYRGIKWFSMPVVAGVLFNATVAFIHVPLIVNESVVNGPLHYGLHVLVVVAGLLMWMPVCGPIPEFRMGVAGTMVYLFLQSVLPTVPAAWLTFAEDVVYKAYDVPTRLWGISVIDDQQLAGAVMKTAGGIFLWAIIIYLFFTKFAAGNEDSYDYKRRGKIPPSEIVGNDEIPLTTEDIEREFAKTVAPSDGT